MLNKKMAKFLISAISVTIIILVPIHIINGLYTAHHVCNGMLYDAVKITVAGKLPDEGFPAITPIPYLHATILYITTGLQILQLNTLYLVLFQLVVGLFVLVLLSRALDTHVEQVLKHAFVITIVVMILYWNVYPSVIYEYGFHHQWYGVYLVAFVTIFISSHLSRNWKKTFATLYPFLVSIPFTHPFAEAILLTFLIIASAITLLMRIISGIRFEKRNYSVSLDSLLVLFIAIAVTTYLNDILVSLVLKQYISLLSEKLRTMHNEVLNYVSLVTSVPVHDPLIILSSIGFKYFVFTLNIVFPLVYTVHYLAILMRKRSRSDSGLYEDSHFISVSAFSLSLAFYPIVNVFLRYLSFAFVERYLYFLFILIVLNGMLLIGGSMRQRSLLTEEGEKSNKVIAGAAFVMLVILLSGLFSTLITLPSRVPLTLFYAAYRAHVVDLNLYLAHYLTNAVTLTPGYYIMPQYLNNLVNEVILYTYVAGDVLRKLFETDVIILDMPCQGICYQLRSAGLYDLDYRKLYMSLMHTRNLIYNNAQLELLLKT